MNVRWWVQQLVDTVGVHAHCCPLDRECRSFRAPPRLYLSWTRGGDSKNGTWALIVALSPQGTTQLFDWRTRRYGDRFGWVSLHPPRHWTKNLAGEYLEDR